MTTDITVSVTHAGETLTHVYEFGATPPPPDPDPPTPAQPIRAKVINSSGVNVRTSTVIADNIVNGSPIPFDTIITVEAQDIITGGYQWRKIVTANLPQFAGMYCVGREIATGKRWLEILPDEPTPPEPPPTEPPPTTGVKPPQLSGERYRIVTIKDAGDTFEHAHLGYREGADYRARPGVFANTAHMFAYWDRSVSTHEHGTVPRWPDYITDGLATWGNRLFRAWLNWNKPDYINQMLDNTEAALDMMQAHGVKALICLQDPGTGMHCQGDDHWFDGGVKKGYFGGAYEEFQMPWAEKVVTRFRGHDAVYGWQIANEMTLHSVAGSIATPKEAENIRRYYKDISELIWSLDKTRVIFPGHIGTEAAAPSVMLQTDALRQEYAIQFYFENDKLHASNHAYQYQLHERVVTPQDVWKHERGAIIDSYAAKIHGRVWIVDEFGACQGDRKEAVENFLLRIQLGRDCDGAGQWSYGFEKQNSSGNLDDIWGFDNILPGNREWYDLLCGLFRVTNARLTTAYTE